jgi:hypothetical protein
MWPLDKGLWQEQRRAVVTSDPPPDPAAAARTRRYQMGVGLLIWLGFAALGVAVLYWFSVLAGD